MAGKNVSRNITEIPAGRGALIIRVVRNGTPYSKFLSFSKNGGKKETLKKARQIRDSFEAKKMGKLGRPPKKKKSNQK